MTCKYTPLTALTGNLRAINSSCEDDFSTQLPFLNDIWDDKARNYPVRYGINIWRDEPTMTRNGIIFGFGDQILETGWDESLQLYTKMNFRTSMMFLDAPIYDWNYTTPGNCMYEVGALTRAEYTKAECDLSRNTNLDKDRKAADVANWGAYPDADYSHVLDVLLEYYGNTWYRESWSGNPSLQSMDPRCPCSIRPSESYAPPEGFYITTQRAATSSHLGYLIYLSEHHRSA